MNNSKKESENGNDEKTKDEVAVLSALLDFFSDAGLGYVSAFVACIFGLFATLSLLQSQDRFGFLLLSLVYLLLSAGGMYSLLNFFYYIRMANRIKRIIVSGTRYKGKFETIFEEDYKKDAKNKPRLNIWRLFFSIKGKKILQLVSFSYLTVVLLPWIVLFFGEFTY